MKKLFPILCIIITYFSCGKKHDIQKNCCKQDHVYEIADSAVLFIPNIFTPNGNGINDILFIRSKNISSVTITILNKKDEEIYKSNSLTEHWDGKHTGGKWSGQTIEGHYSFTVDAVTTNGKNIHAESDISVITDPSKYCLKNLSNCAFDTQYSLGIFNSNGPSGEEKFFKKCN